MINSTLQILQIILKETTNLQENMVYWPSDFIFKTKLGHMIIALNIISVPFHYKKYIALHYFDDLVYEPGIFFVMKLINRIWWSYLYFLLGKQADLVTDNLSLYFFFIKSCIFYLWVDKFTLFTIRFYLKSRWVWLKITLIKLLIHPKDWLKIEIVLFQFECIDFFRRALVPILLTYFINVSLDLFLDDLYFNNWLKYERPDFFFQEVFFYDNDTGDAPVCTTNNKTAMLIFSIAFASIFVLVNLSYSGADAMQLIK